MWTFFTLWVLVPVISTLFEGDLYLHAWDFQGLHWLQGLWDIHDMLLLSSPFSSLSPCVDLILALVDGGKAHPAVSSSRLVSPQHRVPTSKSSPSQLVCAQTTLGRALITGLS